MIIVLVGTGGGIKSYVMFLFALKMTEHGLITICEFVRPLSTFL